MCIYTSIYGGMTLHFWNQCFCLLFVVFFLEPKHKALIENFDLYHYDHQLYGSLSTP
jgi:hypothetical protein